MYPQLDSRYFTAFGYITLLLLCFFVINIFWLIHTLFTRSLLGYYYVAFLASSNLTTEIKDLCGENANAQNIQRHLGEGIPVGKIRHQIYPLIDDLPASRADFCSDSGVATRCRYKSYIISWNNCTWMRLQYARRSRSSDRNGEFRTNNRLVNITATEIMSITLPPSR